MFSQPAAYFEKSPSQLKIEEEDFSWKQIVGCSSFVHSTCILQYYGAYILIILPHAHGIKFVWLVSCILLNRLNTTVLR